MRGTLGLCLALGALAFVNATASVLTLGLAGVLRGRAADRDARRRSQLWLGLRLLPAGAALAAAAVVAAAFARYEPRDADEALGPGLLALAATGALLGASSLRRVWRARRATRRFVTERLAGARSLVLADAPAPVLAVTLGFPAVALVGTRRPRLFLAESALQGLTAEELTVVLAHEGAHTRARDNLKALLVEAAVVPFGLGDGIERDWRQAAEEDADERAARGSADRALSLASALVKVARLTPAGASLALAATTLHRGEGLALRVNRLLAGPKSTRPVAGTLSLGRGLTLLAFGVLAVASSLPYLLPTVHQTLETVVRALP